MKYPFQKGLISLKAKRKDKPQISKSEDNEDAWFIMYQQVRDRLFSVIEISINEFIKSR